MKNDEPANDNRKKTPWWLRLANRCTAKGKVRVIYDRVLTDPYLIRFYLHPRWLTLGLFRVVIHRFVRSDSLEDGLHDHPWPYISVILDGGYIEHTPQGSFRRKPGQVLFRRARHLHRVELLSDGVPVYTLFIMGPRIRAWGFWVGNPPKFYPWKEWIAIRSKDKVA
jgi:hypothetical protein